MDGNANGKEVIVRKETLVGASRQTEKSNLFWKTNTKKKYCFVRLFPGVAIQDKM